MSNPNWPEADPDTERTPIYDEIVAKQEEEK